MQFFDCIIIGNGSIGMAIASDLSRESSSSFRISIFGKKNREGSASLAAGAMINVFGEIEYDTLTYSVTEHNTRRWIGQCKSYKTILKGISGKFSTPIFA